MKRRDFIQISSLSLAALLVEGCKNEYAYDITFLNDMAAGHQVFEHKNYSNGKKIKIKYLIVGGGLAGLSAAYQLKQEDFMLFEVSDILGGTSAGSLYQDIPLCHGAHYDLSYPSYYGREVLAMLEDLNISQYDRFSDSWKFVDKQYLIPKNRESRTMAYGSFRMDVLPAGEAKSKLIELITTFSGRMPMPTRLIEDQFHDLNNQTFHDFIIQKISINKEFSEGLDYHMKDDYGADAKQVSALAGIHYFSCRPYYTQPVELFSPPEGNSYFTQKICSQLPKNQIKVSSTIRRIVEKNAGFEVSVLDLANNETIKVCCDKIIYAGNKYALKYIYPKDNHLFENNQYAPWVVVNFVLKKELVNRSFWQNEIISNDKSLMGFVDSKAQYAVSNKHQILTVYYCYKPEEREMMSLIRERKNRFVNNTLDHLEAYFNRPLKRNIDKIFIKQMGHAMPIAAVGYLFNDANTRRSNPNLVYAGVDNGRLPLLVEAIDSGIMASREFLNA